MTNVDNSPAWSERAVLFPKRFDYVFSLEVRYKFRVLPAAGSPVPLVATPSQSTAADFEDGAWDTFHVRGEEFIHTADGVEHQYPRARLRRGADSIAIADEGAVSLDGTLLFETDTPDLLAMTYSGVLTLEGGTAALLALNSREQRGPSGRAVIGSTQEVVNPKYRWLVQNRLVGVADVRTVKNEQARPDRPHEQWYLLFDYDFYIAS